VKKTKKEEVEKHFFSLSFFCIFGFFLSLSLLSIISLSPLISHFLFLFPSENKEKRQNQTNSL